MNEKPRIKPVIVLPPEAMSKQDIQSLRENGFCVVEAKDPSAVRFMEPPPQGYDAQDRAAIKLCRMIISEPSGSNKAFYAGHLKERLAEILMLGESLPIPQPVKKV